MGLRKYFKATYFRLFLILFICFPIIFVVFQNCAAPYQVVHDSNKSSKTTNDNMNGGELSVDVVPECPTNYIFVPSVSPYTSVGFCVAKYEASASDSVGVSVSGATPWVKITQPNSITACRANGLKYDLISNAEWQTVAQNIEQVSDNWSSGTVGNSGGLSRGHSDGSPSYGSPGNVLATSSDDTQGCIYTEHTCSNIVWDVHRRTHTLSNSNNGSVIWNFAGNAWEWVNDTNSTVFGGDYPISGVTDTQRPLTGTVGSITGTSKVLFGTSADFSGLNVTPWGGFGNRWFHYITPDGPIIRGGSWGDGDRVGVFAVLMNYNTSYSNISIGFRCSFHPSQ